jgi:hypothetical protein
VEAVVQTKKCLTELIKNRNYGILEFKSRIN